MLKMNDLRRGCAVLAAIACLVTVYGCASQAGPDSEIAMAALDPMAGGVPVRVGIMDSPVVQGGDTTYFVVMLDEPAQENQVVTLSYSLEGDPNADLWRAGFTPQTTRTIALGQQSTNVKLQTKSGANGIITIGVKSSSPAAGLTKYASLQVRP